jgi:hypothetical protein
VSDDKPKCGVCAVTPEQAKQMHEANPSDRFPVRMLLDHRCPIHGEKAQPNVWGRHKDMILKVSLGEWEVLSTKKEDTNEEAETKGS